jgi:hypothetical protein
MVKKIFLLMSFVGLLAAILISCGGDGNNAPLALHIQLPEGWESLLDMDVLNASVSTPYVGTIRIVVGEGDGAKTWEFAWDDRGGTTGKADLSGGGLVRIQAVTAGTVIMEETLTNVESGDLEVTLRESGGFSVAGSLLHCREDHSAVAVGDTIMVIGGNLSTGVIEEIASSGQAFRVNAFADSLAYPRKGQKVLQDAASGRLFVFKGTIGNQYDNIFEIINSINGNITDRSITSFRKNFSPVQYGINAFLFNGYDQDDSWLINTLIINLDSFFETMEGNLGLNSEREKVFCIGNGIYFVCVGGREGLNYRSDINRFDLDLKIELTKTYLNSPKDSFSITKLNNNRVLITGGIGDEGYLNEVEIIDLENGSSTRFGPGLVKERAKHMAIQVDLNNVLIFGGWEPSEVSRSAEILNLTTGQSTLLPWRMRVPRAGHTATLMPDGRVLVLGGSMEDRTIEVWNPPSGL